MLTHEFTTKRTTEKSWVHHQLHRWEKPRVHQQARRWTNREFTTSPSKRAAEKIVNSPTDAPLRKSWVHRPSGFKIKHVKFRATCFIVKSHEKCEKWAHTDFFQKTPQWIHYDLYSPLPSGHNHIFFTKISNFRWDQSRTTSNKSYRAYGHHEACASCNPLETIASAGDPAAFSRQIQKLGWNYPERITLFENRAKNANPTYRQKHIHIFNTFFTSHYHHNSKIIKNSASDGEMTSADSNIIYYNTKLWLFNLTSLNWNHILVMLQTFPSNKPIMLLGSKRNERLQCSRQHYILSYM